jgi:hypothetical protein
MIVLECVGNGEAVLLHVPWISYSYVHYHSKESLLNTTIFEIQENSTQSSNSDVRLDMWL